MRIKNFVLISLLTAMFLVGCSNSNTVAEDNSSTPAIISEVQTEASKPASVSGEMASSAEDLSEVETTESILATGTTLSQTEAETVAAYSKTVATEAEPSKVMESTTAKPKTEIYTEPEINFSDLE